MLRVEGNKTIAYCDIKDCEEYAGIVAGNPVGAARLRVLGWYIKKIDRKTRVCLCPTHGRPLYETSWQKKRDTTSVLDRMVEPQQE